jgi:integrase
MKLLSKYIRGDSDCFYTDFYINGRRIRETTKQSSKKEALKFARQLYVELTVYGDRPHTLGSKLLSEVIPEYIDAVNSNPNDIRSLKWALDNIGDVPIGKIERSHFVKLQKIGKRLISPETKKPILPQTINRKITPLLALLNKAFKWEYIKFCPNYDELSVVPAKVRIPYTAEEQMKIIQACSSTNNSHYQDFFTVLLDTGKRISSIRSMKKTDVHNDAEYWILPTQKNDTHNEYIYFADSTREIIKRNIAKSPSKYVFYNPNSTKRGDMGECRTAWTTIRKHAGVHKDWHTCKTTAMTRATEQGFSDRQLMNHFNHKDPRSIKPYSKTNATVQKEMANRIANSVENGRGYGRGATLQSKENI